MPATRRIAFVAPRFAEGNTLGGAETLLRRLAERAAAAGRDVDFLTTCARNHFTWANEIAPGVRTINGMRVRFFPVDGTRDLDTFRRVQDRISHGAEVSRDDELLWQKNNVNSSALYDHLRSEGGAYERIVMGPYLFGLIYFASEIHPRRTLLLPCLHDESFARLRTVRDLFLRVAGWVFNSEPERDLALRLYGLNPAPARIVGMGIDPFEANAARFRAKYRIGSPFVLYSGRREPLKGTPLLMDYLLAFRERTGQDLKLVLTGSGPIEPPPALATHIHDLGFVSEEDKHDAMAAAEVFCHPSANESLSIVILESWLAGTPVLVHAAGDVMPYHCRKSGGGLWFRNYPEFEEGLLLLTSRRDVREQMADSGRSYVKSVYAWNTVEPRLLGALDAPIGDS